SSTAVNDSASDGIPAWRRGAVGGVAPHAIKRPFRQLRREQLQQRFCLRVVVAERTIRCRPDLEGNDPVIELIFKEVPGLVAETPLRKMCAERLRDDPGCRPFAVALPQPLVPQMIPLCVYEMAVFVGRDPEQLEWVLRASPLGVTIQVHRD